MYPLKEIANFIGGEILGDYKDVLISGVCDIENGENGCITYIRNEKYLKYVDINKASAFIIDENCNNFQFHKPVVKVNNASLSFIKILKKFKNDMLPIKVGIDDKAYISPKAQIGKNVYIGPFVVIQDNVIIEDNVSINSGTFIGEKSIIKNGSFLNSNITIYNHVIIGTECRIESGTIIGSEGFGVIQDNKTNYSIPHVGSVVIGNNVSIGSNCCIDRGTINNTIIGNKTKLDNLIQIGHNVKIGKNCLISSQVGIAGSSILGDNVTIAGQSGVIDHINIGNNSTIAVKSCVYKNIKDNSFVSGNPAIDHKKRLKNEVIFRNLSERYKKIKK